MKLSKRIVRTAIVATVSLALLVAVPLLSILNTKAANSRQEGGSTNYNEAIPAGSYNVQINVTSFVPATGLAGVRMVIGQVDDRGNYLPFSRNGSALQLVANSRITTFNNIDAIPQIDVSFASIASSSNDYPFDKYTVLGVFELFTVNESFPSYVLLSGAIDSWTVDSEVGGGTDGSTAVYVTLNIKRNVIIQFFAIFIAVVMWVVSISALILASTVWIRHRKVEPPTIAVVGALLFALPAMRNNVPGNPEIGVTFDVASYFWCLLIAAVSVIMLMWNYIVMYQADKKNASTIQSAATKVDIGSDPKTPTETVNEA